MTRRAVFDPSRLDDELAELLPPVPPAASPQREQIPQPAQTGNRAGAIPSTAPDAPVQQTPAGNAKTAVVPVRVPRPLYEALVRELLGPLVEKPSYAQVIAWTCTDHPDDVRAELRRMTNRNARAPRGRRIAADTVPLTPRFRPAELDILDSVTREVDGDATRTAAVIAALRVAVKHGLTTT